MKTFIASEILRAADLNSNFSELQAGTAFDDQEAWIAPTLLNGWVNYNTANFSGAGYMKDFMGFVHLRGLLKSGTINQNMYVLPAGYRPEKQLHIASVSNGLFCNVTILSNGSVLPQNGSATWWSLDGITFRAYQ